MGCACHRSVNRQKTPWVIVGVHAPWYHTFTTHWKEVRGLHMFYLAEALTRWTPSHVCCVYFRENEEQLVKLVKL